MAVTLHRDQSSLKGNATAPSCPSPGRSPLVWVGRCLLKGVAVPRPVILDCDPGHDDALAILLAAASPALDLLAVTTVAGNQVVEKTAVNAARVCAMAGLRDVPVAAGCSRPLRGELRIAEEIHGVTGLDGPGSWEGGEVELSPLHAVELMRQIIVRSAEPVTVVGTGPLTNIATLITEYPEVKDRLASVVFMG